MATRHDKRRPIRNALLKWQLQQDRKRVAEAQHRLMRTAVPSPASPLALDHNYDHRPTVRRPRPTQYHDLEEDALMTLIMEREEQESGAPNQHMERSSKLNYPSVLPPLRRPEGSKPPPNTPMKNVTLRPTGQKLNAAGDFYSPVRPRESSLNSSTSEFRQSLAFSRIKAPTPKRLVGRTAAPSPKNPLKYDQMKTPDRWRTTAMRSNQEELNESAVRRWEEEDARQADRLLEKAARDGDDEALWNDLFYGTKAARAKTNQLPEQPVVYSTSSFPEVFSRSRSNSHDSVYYQDDSNLKSSQLANGLPSGQAKAFTRQQSDAGSRAADSNAPTSTQTISEMLASMEKSTIDPVEGDIVAGDDKLFDGSGGGDKENFSHGNATASGPLVLQCSSADVEIPRWSVIVVASCLVLGTGGFFMEELMSFVGLFSRRVPFTRGEQERMRDRVKALQQDLQIFQLSTSEIEVNSQTALTELRQHMNRMRLDREKHQHILANEMQELRRHILHVTYELVEKEHESIQNQLEELIKVQAVNEQKQAPTSNVKNEKPKETPEIEAESEAAVDNSMEAPESDIPIDTKLEYQVHDEETHLEQPGYLPAEEQVAAVAGSSMQSSHGTNNVQVPVENSPVDQVLVVAPSKSLPEELEGVQLFNLEASLECPIEEIKVDEIVVAPVPAVQGGSKINSSSSMKKITKPTSGMSWDGILLLIGIMFLAACIMLRVYNINRRKKWFEQRRRRRNQRAWLLAQRRAREMVEIQDDSDEWDEEETEETPTQDSEEESKQELKHESSDCEDNQNGQVVSSPPAAYRMSTEVRSLCSG
ncbi:hypothetical protein P3T76_013569 [Phytophthora citrophthora]|uniref:Transmembrane protein n=1 Tax=Phytophthora citrophthora TaxID=4793 RepID=A0AAD9LC53_9STRA|nr:hypothetical protein P3T76_013569 [Phytophthora citrophthora]